MSSPLSRKACPSSISWPIVPHGDPYTTSLSGVGRADRSGCEAAFAELAARLVKVQRFYDSLGGIVGYQLKCLELILAAKAKEDSVDSPETDDSVNFLVPSGPKLQGEAGRQAAQLSLIHI